MEGDTTKAMLVTANVGSIFEEPETMFPSWLSAFYQASCLNVNQPSIVALHCQEVGGKNYEASMQHVNHFIKTLLACEELQKYDRARIILDEDYTASDKFTALGSLYFIHQDVPNVLIWDFVDCKFIEVEGREVLSGNIENVPIKEKAKFPQHFFPEFKWSRKGFLRTRWSVNNCIFDLVNIHLFHDASNIVAMQSSPSVYAENRQRALLHTLQRFENDKYSKVPLFIFGDFNFRLDSNLLIQELTSKLVAKQFRGKKDQVNKIEYTEEGNGKVLLTIGSKSFDYYEKHSDLFSNMNKWLHQYDTEFQSYREQLMEFEISFPPSYPFCENVKDGVSYMKTRVPSWCDRILLTHSAKDIIVQDLSHPVLYDIIGKESCMGDHKPVYLFFHIKPGKGKSPAEDQTLLVSSTTSELLRSRARTLSINGELVGNVDMEAINIHDYAVFEQEQNLIEEFRESIKNKASKDSDGDKKRSFQDVVRDVRTMEKVLKQWPGRSLDRHHSSSSEDYPSDDSEGKSLADGERDDANSVEASPLLVDHNENCRVVHYLQAADIVNSGEGVQANAVSERDVEVTLVGGTQGSGGCRDKSSGKAGVVMLAQHDDGVHVESSNPPASSNPVNQSGREQLQSGKNDQTSPSADFFAGCCSCVLF
ncbi:type I inositol 1 4 5-trisphosphate 5-phosphatase-like isoform X1 [Biomphalaria pfeifferi]|uniref:inositol-polyphosphate 5-phosphatase n=1 Tax=Biomphalaria pfeifferi TaxID=112525 RepID=A0AAD8CCM9_BIOPF|nr:type I inositol 1 4 5-trisphosphate 5-phosphatase-like isoform X1 [Biomphalaria pfeifferi]